MTRPLGGLNSSALLLLTLAACGGTGVAPADHTVNHGGVLHKPGLTNPLVNCVACHGARLQGGEGPSCTSCHGVKW
jgi:mono/diheme cytochrome c family protein